MRQALYGTQHPDYALTLDIQGQILRARGEFAAAEQKLDEAFRVLETDLSERPVEAARVLCHLASLSSIRTSWRERKSFFKKHWLSRKPSWERSMRKRRKSRTTWRPFISRKAILRAHEMFERTLVIREKILPPNHPSIAQAYNNLAAVCSRQSHLSDAERLYKQALSIRESLVGAWIIRTLPKRCTISDCSI